MEGEDVFETERHRSVKAIVERELGDYREGSKSGKVEIFIVRFSKAEGQKVAVYRKGNSSDYAHTEADRRREHAEMSDVVAKHRHAGNQLKRQRAHLSTNISLSSLSTSTTASE